jgi:hypothetical protein
MQFIALLSARKKANITIHGDATTLKCKTSPKSSNYNLPKAADEEKLAYETSATPVS